MIAQAKTGPLSRTGHENEEVRVGSELAQRSCGSRDGIADKEGKWSL